MDVSAHYRIMAHKKRVLVKLPNQNTGNDYSLQWLAIRDAATDRDTESIAEHANRRAAYARCSCKKGAVHGCNCSPAHPSRYSGCYEI